MEVDALAPWLLAVKVALYASALAAVGMTQHVFIGIVEPHGRLKILRCAGVAALAAMVLCLAKLLIINAQLAGSFDAIFSIDAFNWSWRLHRSETLALLIGGGSILVAALTRAAPAGWFGSLAIAVSFGLSGHTHGSEPANFGPWAVVGHVAIASFWFAAPLTLWPTFNLSGPQIASRLHRFSRIAVVGVPILFALGIWLSWSLTGGLRPLLTSAYGNILLAKLFVVTTALAAGASNKLVTTPIIQRDLVRGRNRLIVSLSIEALAFITAIVLVGWATTMTGPPEM